ncbi:MAG: pyridoxamine 5-phosphate oxidase family protein [Glaciihabitans sp.]|nr:pyridoxamine 5-phosphate oxidase family protein [Glaciihabitans sp.]
MSDAASAPVETLTAEDCWQLLSSADVGRLAVRDGEEVDVFPVNFLVKDGEIFFRSAPGAKMMFITADPHVAFEADGVSERLRWSVVVRGTATRLGTDTEIEASGIQALRTQSPSTKWNYVRITPASISGSRFASSRRTV